MRKIVYLLGFIISGLAVLALSLTAVLYVGLWLTLGDLNLGQSLSTYFTLSLFAPGLVILIQLMESTFGTGPLSFVLALATLILASLLFTYLAIYFFSQLRKKK